MRQSVIEDRTTFAAGTLEVPARVSFVRRDAAEIGRRVLRLALAPAALATAAIAGVVFVILVPICGIATLAEGLSRGSWRAAIAPFRGRSERDNAPHVPRRSKYPP